MQVFDFQLSIQTMACSLPPKYRNLAKNPMVGKDTMVWCWHCGTQVSQKRNLEKQHHNPRQNDPLHQGKSVCYYVKGTTGFIAAADPPFVLGFCDISPQLDTYTINDNDTSTVMTSTQVTQPQTNPTPLMQSANDNEPEQVTQPMFDPMQVTQAPIEPMMEEDASASASPVDPSSQISTPHSRKRKLRTLFHYHGELQAVRTEVEYLIQSVSMVDGGDTSTSTATVEYLEKVKSCVDELQGLIGQVKSENKRLQKERQKAESLQGTLELAMDMLKSQNESIKNHQAHQPVRTQRAQNASPSAPAVASKPDALELQMVPQKFHKMVCQIIRDEPDMILTNGRIRCKVCKDNWKRAPGMLHAPVFDFEIHKDSKTSVKRHIKLSNDHHQCFEAKLYHSKSDRRMQELLKSERMKVNEMTCNVIRVVYFLLKYDLSALMFEKISNLLVTVNALIGNRLHSRKTAMAIAIAIDEVYMKLLTQYLASDECKYFGMEFDELTDKGTVKSLLSKIKFIENGNVQNFVFNIFESGGTSEDLYEAFVADIRNNFVDMNDDQVDELLNEKFIGGCSDRASKIMKVGDLLFDSLDKYIHIPCANHMAETSWKNTIKIIEDLEKCKDIIKECCSLSSNSSKRTKRLQALCDEYEEKFLKLKGIFEIRFLTHALRAVDAELNDHEALLQITKELSKDTTVKKEKRKDFKALHGKLKDSTNFAQLLGMKGALEVLSIYQTFNQKDGICAIDRTFSRMKLKSTILNVSNDLSPDLLKHMEKIDFENKCWTASDIHCNKLVSRDAFIQIVVSFRKTILNEFIQQHDELHDAQDPKQLKHMSHVLDMRLWNFEQLFIDHDHNLEETKDILKQKIGTHIKESTDWLIGEDTNALATSIGIAIDVLVVKYPRNSFLKLGCQRSTIRDQWSMMREHPQLRDETALWDLVDRQSCLPNHEAGCERANSKYNRSKNKLSTRMGLPMILARNRAGSNGPPLHQFKPQPIVKYWREHNHRLALKANETSESQVVQRIRKEEETKYTSQIFLK